MATSRDQGPDSVRGRLEFPNWYRSFSKSYLAWANAPGDLKTPLLLQGPGLATAESWLLAAPDKLSESQKRFIVRSISQRAKGGIDGVAGANGSRSKWRWRRSSDRNLWQLYLVIGVGLWFFSPGILRDVMERALNAPSVYDQMKDRREPLAGTQQPAGQSAHQEVADHTPAPSQDHDQTDQTSRTAADVTTARTTPSQSSAADTSSTSERAGTAEVDGAPLPAQVAPAPEPLSSRLASIAQEQADKGQMRLALLVGIEAMEQATLEDDATAAMTAKLAALLERSLSTRERLGALAARSATAASTMFCRDARAVAAITGEREITIWRAGTARASGTLQASVPSLLGFALDRDCSRMLVPNEDFNVEVRQLAGGRQTALLAGHEASILAAAFSADGRTIVTAGQDGSARLWDAASGRLRHVLSGHDWHVVDAQFSPEGRRVLTASSDMTARIWDTSTGRQLQVLAGHQGVLISARFTRGGRNVLTMSWDGTARLWDAVTGAPLHTLSQEGGLATAQSDGTGDRIVTSDSEGGIQLWSTDTGARLAAVSGEGAGVKALAFPPGNRVIAVLRWSGSLSLIDATSLQPLAPLADEGLRIRDIQLGEASQWLVAITEDGQRLAWPLTDGPSAALALAKSMAPRCLSLDERASLGLSGEAPAWCADLARKDAALR